MSEFVRYDDGIVTATKRYVKDQKEVSLVGVIHIGKDEYYTQAKEYLDSLDLVLWEGIVEKPQTRKGREFDAFAKRRRKHMKNMAKEYGVSYQYDSINRELFDDNWEHCDMDPDTLANYLEDHPKEYSGIKLSAFLADLDIVPKKEDFLKAHPETLKDAESFEVIVKKRNNIVKSRMNELIESGPKRIGIFYGTAHMHDFEKYLLDKGFELTDEKWLKAIE